jgi:vacuolar-type H+-ATPase subunit E/Vma4
MATATASRETTAQDVADANAAEDAAWKAYSDARDARETAHANLMQARRHRRRVTKEFLSNVAPSRWERFLRWLVT